VRKNCSFDLEKLLKFEDEGWEVATIYSTPFEIDLEIKKCSEYLLTLS
jgi:hypothetical protein